MSHIVCPCCNTETTATLGCVSAKDITDLYMRNGIEIARLFENVEMIGYVVCSTCQLKFFHPMILGDDAFYGDLQQEDWYFLHGNKTEYDFAKAYVPETAKVLDVGSGRGVFKRYLNCEFYQGLEFSTKAIELARIDNVNVSDESIENHCKHKKNFYDVVVIFQVLEHVKDISGFLSACLECLKVDGKLIIAVPNNEGFLKDAQNNWLNLPPHHQLHWNEVSLRHLSAKFNLDIIGMHKERVTNIHRRWFYYIKINRFLSALTSKNLRIVDLSVLSKCRSKIASFLARIVQFSEMHQTRDGHTISIVFSKKGLLPD